MAVAAINTNLQKVAANLVEHFLGKSKSSKAFIIWKATNKSGPSNKKWQIYTKRPKLP